MKNVTAFLMILLFVPAVFASETIELQGADADKLSNALQRAGAFFDCGAGQCGTVAAEVSCTKDKTVKNGSACSLQIQNENGDLTTKNLKGRRAQNLTEILIDAGVVNCAMQGCQGAASSIECTSSNDPAAGPDSSQCTLLTAE